jgi:hypothetical protein
VDRLKAALENLDQAIDMAESALERRNNALDRVVEERAAKRVRVAVDTAERALNQARQGEARASERAVRQHEVTNIVAGRLDQAIMRLEKITGS